MYKIDTFKELEVIVENTLKKLNGFLTLLLHTPKRHSTEITLNQTNINSYFQPLLIFIKYVKIKISNMLFF